MKLFASVILILAMLASLIPPIQAAPAAESPDAARLLDSAAESVSFRGVTYVSLAQLAPLLGGKVSFGDTNRPLGLQPLRIVTQDSEWRFPNGGDRILRLPTREQLVLQNPLLVRNGAHYLPVEESASIFGYQTEGRTGNKITFRGRTIRLNPKRIDRHAYPLKVTSLVAMHQLVTTEAPLQALRSLNRPNDSAAIAAGTTLLLRRRAMVDGKSYYVATDTKSTFESFLITDQPNVSKYWRPSTAPETNAFQTLKAWFAEESEQGRSLRHGPRVTLEKTACLTVDLCWSLRPIERRLFDTVAENARRNSRPTHLVAFLSGRWLDQHPEELGYLLDFSHQSGVQITWGLHSWAHPKTGGFMNEFSADALVEDTLKLERRMLEYGIVPSIYYRFPGLIHDKERRETIAGLDLLSIDCESWMAIVARGESSPWGNAIDSGSIVLVHGNGNEPDGIPPFQDWLKTNSNWNLGPIHQFLPTLKTSRH